MFKLGCGALEIRVRRSGPDGRRRLYPYAKGYSISSGHPSSLLCFRMLFVHLVAKGQGFAYQHNLLMGDGKTLDGGFEHLDGLCDLREGHKEATAERSAKQDLN